MFDVHSHSTCSDGTETPAEVVDIAKARGLGLFALTDHDSIAGVSEALRRAEEVDLPLLTGCEMEASFRDKLHLLCLGMDIYDSNFVRMVERQREYRLERNEKLNKRLRSLGFDISDVLNTDSDCVTRAHYARAMVDAGYAENMNQAYERFLGKGACAYVHQERLSPEQVITATKNAGGVVVLAHPMQTHCEAAPMVKELADAGIWGVEAHYYNASEDEIRCFTSLARAYGLYVTCGSDYHGADRPEAIIGECYRDNYELKRTEQELMRRFF